MIRLRLCPAVRCAVSMIIWFIFLQANDWSTPSCRADTTVVEGEAQALPDETQGSGPIGEADKTSTVGETPAGSLPDDMPKRTESPTGARIMERLRAGRDEDMESLIGFRLDGATPDNLEGIGQPVAEKKEAKPPSKGLMPIILRKIPYVETSRMPLAGDSNERAAPVASGTREDEPEMSPSILLAPGRKLHIRKEGDHP